MRPNARVNLIDALGGVMLSAEPGTFAVLLESLQCAATNAASKSVNYNEFLRLRNLIEDAAAFARANKL